MTPRSGGRPNRDRVMFSFYIARSGKAAIKKLAEERGETQADTVRSMLAFSLAKMPRGWHPKPTDVRSAGPSPEPKKGATTDE